MAAGRGVLVAALAVLAWVEARRQPGTLTSMVNRSALGRAMRVSWHAAWLFAGARGAPRQVRHGICKPDLAA